MSKEHDWHTWYEAMTHCGKNKDGYHNFIVHGYSMTQYSKQATGLICSHCLQMVDMSHIQQFNAVANSSEISDSA
jgi:hypothetical protein